MKSLKPMKSTEKPDCNKIVFETIVVIISCYKLLSELYTVWHQLGVGDVLKYEDT